MAALKRIEKEYKDFLKDPVPNTTIELDKENTYHWKVIMKGPPNTIYEGGTFYITIQFPRVYPFEKPKLYFCQRIFHYAFHHSGYLCCEQKINEMLYDQWFPAITIPKILSHIYFELLHNPFDGEPCSYNPVFHYYRYLSKDQLMEIGKKWTQTYAKSD